MFKLLITFLAIPIFPLLLIFDALKIEKPEVKSIIVSFVKLLLAMTIFFPVWGMSYFLLGVAVADYYGFVKTEIPISGTGSMYPTFPKGIKKTVQELSEELVAKPYMLPYPNGISIFNKKIFSYKLGHGDIIEFENKKTREITGRLNGKTTGMVKRLIAMSGDTIELRDGLVYLNNKPLKEPYTAKARSTFGGTFAHECQKITVPKNKIFVMGDNRKGSGDSRHELGLIDIDDINYVLPFSDQKSLYDRKWRDTKNDLDKSSKITIDKRQYLQLLNEKRIASQVKPLIYENRLEDSAQKRAEIILQYNDFSFEATRSGYTMKRALDDSGYSNIIWGESPIMGYYEAPELIENQFEFPETRKFLLDKDYQDFGMIEIQGEINNCPTQVIVQHYGGYIPPNYKKEHIEAWKNLIKKLQDIKIGWSDIKDYKDYYEKNRVDVNRINEIISTRINSIGKIVQKMESNQWLNKDEENYANDQDQKLGEEQEKLANKLNSQ